MTSFFYRGRSLSGESVKGEIEASSKSAALSILKRQNVIPTFIELADNRSGTDFKQSNVQSSLASFFGIKKVGINELIMFSRQMYALTRSGIPLIRAINGLADASRSPDLSKVLHEISRSLTQGSTLTNAFRAHPDVFDDLFVSMISMGESTGRLDTAFFQLISHLELENDTRKKIKAATRYPIIVMVAIFIALIIINVKVVPELSHIFSKVGTDLPLPTLIIIASSNFILNFWWLITISVIVGFTGFFYWKNTPQGQLKWAELVLKIPVLGGVFERIALGRFARPLAMMLNAGVPLLQALKVSSHTVGNRHIGQGIEGMLNGIERGESLLATASSSGLFNPLILQMIAVGEETGNVSDLLADISDFYDQEVEYDLKRLAELLEPILLAFMGIMVLTLALGVFLPMWELGAAFQ